MCMNIKIRNNYFLEYKYSYETKQLLLFRYG